MKTTENNTSQSKDSNSPQSIRLKFLGAAKTVTGSRTLLTYGGYQCLIDCGLFQGPREIRERNWEPFPGIEKISAVVLTHAHIDHSGFLPRIAKLGYKNSVYCSPGTQDLCEILLRDAAYLQEEDAHFANESKYSRHEPALPLYDLKDAESALSLLRPLPFHQWHELCPGLSFRFLRAGHILGASQIQFSFTTTTGQHLLTCSGDLGNSRSFILEPPEHLIESDYLILESTYGDRMQPRDNPLDALALVINKVIARGGTLIIPAFSVGRTQELIYMIEKLKQDMKIPQVPVYLDSPMAERSTRAYIKHSSELRKDLQDNGLVNSLRFAQFKSVIGTDESMLLSMSSEAKIVISAAGMLTGGRVLHHLKTKLPDEKNGVLFVGYQAQGTKGLLLKNGLKQIRIHHSNVDVAAEIFSMEHLSAHADADDLLKWVQAMERKPTLTILNHGEENSLRTLKYLLSTELKIPVHIAEPGEEITLT